MEKEIASDIPIYDALFDSDFQKRTNALYAAVRHAWQLKQDDLAFACDTVDCHNQVLRGKLWIGEHCTQAALLPQIRAVVSLGTKHSNYTTHPNIDYHRIDAQDVPDQDLYSHFHSAGDFIESHIRKGWAVLVHCEAGVSRSATICMAYLMIKLGLSFLQSYACVKEARPIVSPNVGFLKQLLQLEIELNLKVLKK